jgi:hypothetical protein
MDLLLLNYTSRPGTEKNTSTYLTTKTVTTQKLNHGKENRQLKHQLAYQEHNCTAPSGVMGRTRRDGNHTT